MPQSELNYAQRGAGAPLVLAHGFPFDHTLWDTQRGNLDRRAQSFIPDLPGFGESPALDGEPSIRAYSDALARWADEIGLDRFVLVGHSMGGYIALDFAQRYAERLRGLVLVCTRAGADSAEAKENRRKQAAAVEQAGDAGPVVEAMLPKLFGSDNPKLAVSVRELMMRQSVAGIKYALAAMAARPDSTSALKKIAMPTLIISGASDQIISAADSESMAREIPDARHVRIGGAGHLAMLEQPARFNQALSRFIGSL